MNKLLITIFLIFTSQCRTRWRLDQFTGCTSTLFTNPLNFRIMKIDYNTACTALEVCAESYELNTNKEDCLIAFEESMKEFCVKYTAVNLWRRRYCYRIVIRNMILAGELSDSLFKGSLKLFDVRLSDGGILCLRNDLTGSVCSQNDIKQLWTVIKLTNQKFIFMDQDGMCLSSTNGSVTNCDFKNDIQWWTLMEKRIGSELMGEDGKVLKIDVAGTVFTVEMTDSDPADNVEQDFSFDFVTIYN